MKTKKEGDSAIAPGWEWLLQKECRSSAGAVLIGISGEVAVGIVLADGSSSQSAAQVVYPALAWSAACVALFLLQSSNNHRDAPGVRDARADDLSGHYVLEHVMEVGSELLLKPDGTFEYMLAYGAADYSAKGTWKREKDSVSFEYRRKGPTSLQIHQE